MSNSFNLKIDSFEALVKCPRCGQRDETVLLDNDGQPYICDDCWNEDQ